MCDDMCQTSDNGDEKADDTGRKAKLQHGRRRGRLKRKRKEVVAKREEMKEGERNL